MKKLLIAFMKELLPTTLCKTELLYLDF